MAKNGPRVVRAGVIDCTAGNAFIRFQGWGFDQEMPMNTKADRDVIAIQAARFILETVLANSGSKGVVTISPPEDVAVKPHTMKAEREAELQMYLCINRAQSPGTNEPQE